MNVPFQSIKSLASDYGENSPNKVDTKKLQKWGNEEVRALLTSEQVDKTVVLLDIKDGEAHLPDNFKKVLQAGYGYIENKECSRQSIIRYVSQKMQGCDIKVEVTCNKCRQSECSCSTPVLIYEVDTMDLANHPEWMASVNKSFYSYGKVGDRYHPYDGPGFTLMRPMVNNFSDKRLLPACVPVHTGTEVEYWIENRRLILSNIKDCKVLLSYHSYKMDKDGYLMIPDIKEVWDTLTFAIDERVNYDRWQRFRKPEDERIYMATRRLRQESAHFAKLKLGKLEPEKFKALWINFFGKQIPHYYAEETFYDYVNDTYRPYK